MNVPTLIRDLCNYPQPNISETIARLAKRIGVGTVTSKSGFVFETPPKSTVNTQEWLTASKGEPPMDTANNNNSKHSSYRQELPQEPLKNGVYGSQPGRYFGVIDNQVVAGPYPHYWQAVDIYRERQEVEPRRIPWFVCGERWMLEVA